MATASVVQLIPKSTPRAPSRVHAPEVRSTQAAAILKFPQRFQFDLKVMSGLVNMEDRRPGVVEQFCAIIERHDEARSHAYARELRSLLKMRNCGKFVDAPVH